MCDGELLPSSDHQLGAYWAEKDTLRFATGVETGGEFVIDIRELQPKSGGLRTVESFHVPPQDGKFSFSPNSRHASFVSEREIVILDVPNPKVLFQTKATQLLYTPPGHFSPDGRLFACGVSHEEICIWGNTPDGYVRRNSLKPRLPFDGFLFSPSAISIIGWGPGGVQLLRLDDRIDPPPPDGTGPHRQNGNHLVAYSAGGTHVATARQGHSVVTIIDLSNARPKSVDMNLQIRDIKIVDDAIFVTDGRKLVSRRLGEGEGEKETIRVHVGPGPLALSNDCSQIAFTLKGTVFLYDVKARKVLGNLATGGSVIDIQFSPDERQLRFIVNPSDENAASVCYCADLERKRSPCFGNVTTECLGGDWSCDSLFRSDDEYRIVGSGSEWVSGSRGNVLWLHPSWRTKNGLEAKWNGKFLTLVAGHHPEPIIIEFQ